MARVRINISTGQSCEKCKKDIWFVYQGFNRCKCGQYLWIKRTENGDHRRYLYGQGAELPKCYRGWSAVTE
jgi:hypothetical protein